MPLYCLAALGSDDKAGTGCGRSKVLLAWWGGASGGNVGLNLSRAMAVREASAQTQEMKPWGWGCGWTFNRSAIEGEPR